MEIQKLWADRQLFAGFMSFMNMKRLRLQLKFKKIWVKTAERVQIKTSSNRSQFVGQL